MTDRDAILSELHQQYAKSLHNFCLSRGVSPDLAEDVVSETFVRVLEKADVFFSLPPEKWKTWLFSTTLNVIREERARRRETPFSAVENLENTLSYEEDFTGFRTDADFRRWLNTVRAELDTERERELFAQIFDQKVDYASLAEHHGTTETGARKMVSRLRQKLREIVNKV